MEQRIKDFIQSGKILSPVAQAQLRQLVERYPYFHAARLLWLASLCQSHDDSFGRELRRAALFLPSRASLFYLIEGDDRLKPRDTTDKLVRKVQTTNTDRTSSLITDFLDSLPEETQRTAGRTRTTDVRVDYMEYLMQTDPNSPVLGHAAAGIVETHGDELIGIFLDNNARIEISDRADEELQKPQLTDENEQENDVFTETLAGIYIKQGKYDKALEIIRQLYLKNPKKNRYFADQVRFLEKLIVNNKNK